MDTETVKSAKVKSTGNNPRKDTDLNLLTKSVESAWRANNHISLIWTDVDKYKASIDAYSTTLTERQGTGGTRKEVTAKLAQLDTDIDKAVATLKSYLVYKYEKDKAPSYYPQFGIERVGKLFIVPRDRNKRVAALKQIQAAVITHGFGNEKYGTAYWQQTADSYNALLTQATTVDGTVAKKVGDKNELRKTIVKTHNALINVLKGNYPDTYKSVLREWGFQKEKY